MSWLQRHSDDIGTLLLRVSIASFILMYGIEKIANPAMFSYIENLFENIGLPALMAYGVYLGEVIAPLLVLIGWRTKFFAAIMSVTMLVVIFLGHYEEIFPLENFSWWGIELQVLFFLNCLAVTLLGAGAFAVSKKHNWD